MSIGEHKSDEAIRALHADALDQLSPRVRAQLQQRRRVALRGEGAQAPASRWRLAFPLAAAAAVGALAIGVQLNSLPPTTSAPTVAVVQPAATNASANADETVIASTLEENPDLYVWLASDDAALMAME
ncbi:hypothetical protein LF41_2806 [Lysobacter dokdonensis DS-58]|uniref:Uncharacterized protein n=1 Tax=Lysobacter dokdonensis DS-58 TaxID=1300345 RepID=A0A0A2WH74_9GAMM|nr:hypothetical protein [Lysobacter dokdonensis]KGQ19546.1 hypothetical protein LF41_2806 [Lysobacter dokdonensis DS-58]